MNKSLSQAEFWDTISNIRKIEGQEHNVPYFCQLASEFLSSKTKNVIYAFEFILRDLIRESNSYNIIAAAKICDGYVSDDNFLYFRAGLISFGKDVFYGAIDSPDIYANELLLNIGGEEVLHITDNSFLKLINEDTTFEEMPRDKANDYWDYNTSNEDPKGEDWEECDLPTRYPILWNLVQKKGLVLR